MVRKNKFGIAALVLAVTMLAYPLQSHSAADITGSYSCYGTNPGSDNGPGYKGTTNITQQGSTYFLTWIINGESFTGLGIRNGNMLSVSWYSGGKTGVVVYQISQKGDRTTLKGVWAAMGGNGSLGKETLSQ